MNPSLSADAFPAGTPLNHFLAWNQARWRRDRRDTILRDLHRLSRRHGDGDDAVEIGVAHLGGSAAARRLVLAFRASLGAGDHAAHAAVFEAFEALAAEIDLGALAR